MINTNILNFIHGIYLTDILKCKSLKETGTLSSMFFNSIFLASISVDYNTVTIEELRNNADTVFQGLVNPRSAILYEASLIDKFTEVIVGEINKHVLTIDEKKSILKRRDAELEFETARRKLTSLPPSRLTCLFIAEDDEDYQSRLNIAGMLSRDEWRPYIYKVNIVENWGMFKADFRWYDKYMDDPIQEYIDNYWAGVPVNEVPSWEYLLEGRIALSDDEEKNHLLINGTFEKPV